MPRPRKTDEQLRADLASVRTMLSDARRDRDRVATALIAIIDVTEGCTCGKKEQARRVATKALEGALDGITAERAAENKDEGGACG